MPASARLSLVSRSSIGPATENASSRPAMHRMCSFGISHFFRPFLILLFQASGTQTRQISWPPSQNESCLRLEPGFAARSISCNRWTCCCFHIGFKHDQNTFAAHTLHVRSRHSKTTSIAFTLGPNTAIPHLCPHLGVQTDRAARSAAFTGGQTQQDHICCFPFRVQTKQHHACCFHCGPDTTRPHLLLSRICCSHFGVQTEQNHVCCFHWGPWQV